LILLGRLGDFYHVTNAASVARGVESAVPGTRCETHGTQEVMDQKILLEKLDKIIALLESSYSSGLALYVNTFCTILAVFAAFVTIYITIKNFRIGIRNEKLEQIFSSIEALSYIYGELIEIYNSLKSYHEDNDQIARNNWLSEYKEKRTNFLGKVQIHDYFEMVLKIEILSRSYL